MMNQRIHEFSQALYDILHRTLIGKGVDEHTAQKVAEEGTDSVLDEFGGENLYIPRNVSGKAAKRNRQIYAEFTGGNHIELSKKYNLTLQQVYAILKKERYRDFKCRQHVLFDAE